LASPRSTSMSSASPTVHLSSSLYRSLLLRTW
jgi:hypothetical protein